MVKNLTSETAPSTSPTSGSPTEEPKAFDTSFAETAGSDTSMANCYCYGPAYPPCNPPPHHD